MTVYTRYALRVYNRILDQFVIFHYRLYRNILKDKIAVILKFDEVSAGLTGHGEQEEQASPGFRKYLSTGHYKRMLARYLFSIKYIKDRTVLDSACGLGWGSYLISSYPKELVSVDINEKALDFARNAWRDERLRFMKHSVLELERLGRRFDVVLGFEIIEHLSVQEAGKYLKGVYDILEKGGKLILSSYFALTESEASAEVKKDIYHIHIYTRDEIRMLLGLAGFSKISFFGNLIVTAGK